MTKEKRGPGRPAKDPSTPWKKKLISFPVPVLEMIEGNLTEFVNDAVLEKLARKDFIK